MQNNLLSIFKAITPDNIKDIPLIDDSMRIFIELLNENSPISSDIKIALSEQTTDGISSELPKIYLYDYYSMIQNIKNNKNIINKFRVWNETLHPSLYPTGLPYIGEQLRINYFSIGRPGGVLGTDEEDDGLGDINLFSVSDRLYDLEHNILQNKAENYFSNRMFKQSKGLKKGIQYIYDIVNEYMVGQDERLPLTFTESGNPFELNMSGSIDKDIYAESVAYLSHPLGFVYNYDYISELRFDDNYSLVKIYEINALEVRCLSGGVESYNKEVISIIQKDNYLKIIFSDNTYLLQENNIVRYYDGSDNLIKLYPPSNHCSIYIDYNIVYKSTLSDMLSFKSQLEFDIDAYNTEITDEIDYTEMKIFKLNFVIGESIIGSDMISRDSDQVEVVNYTDKLLDNNSGHTDEVFNTADVFEDFTIELI